MDAQAQLKACTQALKARMGEHVQIPKVAFVLGSGLGTLANAVEEELVIPYAELAGFPISTAPGHAGRFVFGKLNTTPLIVMQGRVHYYEGYTMQEVVLPIRVLAQLGVQVVVLTNASGGINENFRAGDLMLLRDHITSFVPSPLRGANFEELGPRFPDMTEVYDGELRCVLRETARAQDLLLHEGVYLQVPGPQFETPAEIAAYRALGADTAGMSTTVEAVAARHAGLKVVGISCITNLAAGMSGKPLSSEEVDEVGKQSSACFAHLLAQALPALAASASTSRMQDTL